MIRLAKDNVCNDRFISDDGEIANVFNNYFVNVASQLKESTNTQILKLVKIM